MACAALSRPRRIVRRGPRPHRDAGHPCRGPRAVTAWLSWCSAASRTAAYHLFVPTAWDPDRYLKFRDERRRPYLDLVALVRPVPGMRIVDLGCGPGELTADLAERFDASSVVGVDNDVAMLARARAFASERVSFVEAELDAYPLDDFDLAFSNAALHWLPDHEALFTRLRDSLARGGQLAAQMPNNFAQPTHTIALELANERPFCDVL